jgi:hypothetical protein
MPKGPRGQKPATDPVAAAIKTAKILTGEIEEDIGHSSKYKAAQTFGRKRGKARAAQDGSRAAGRNCKTCSAVALAKTMTMRRFGLLFGHRRSDRMT